MNKVLAFDVATTTGYALIDRGELIDSGYFKLKDKDYRLRFIQLFKQVRDLIKQHSPDLVVIEEVHSTRNVKTTILLAMYVGVSMLAVPEDFKLQTANLVSARYSILKGQGRVNKEDVFNWAVDK